MTLEEFKKLDGWPESIERFAEEASSVTDCPKLQQAAIKYLAALQLFEDAVSQQGVELG